MKRFELIVIALIVAVGAFLRLYHLPNTLMFRGDQGRDAIIAKNILKEGDIALIGPVTSVGNMYLGPLYYYFMVPFLAMTYPDPVGPAYGVALVNILTIYMIYWVGKKTINTGTGIVAAAIFALMPMAIIYGRFSWNPNIAPFFSILIFYTLYRWWQTRSIKTFFGTAILIGLLAQTHYVSLTVAITVGLLWLSKLIKDKHLLTSLKELGAGLLGFGITTLPLVIFDFRHDHIISNQFLNFFLSPEKHIGSAGFIKQINQIIDKAEYLLASLLHIPQSFSQDKWIMIAALILIALLVIGFKFFKKTAPSILFVWLATAIVGTSFYSHVTFPHYLTYCYPILSLLWAYLVVELWQSKLRMLGTVIGIGLLGMLITSLSSVGWQGNGTRMLSKAVNSSLPFIEEPYNIALLSDDKDYKGMSYRYFFETGGAKPKNLDDYTQLETLVLIDETFLENPRSVPIYEIEAAKDFKLEKQIIIPEGPWVYILKKG